MLEINQLKVQRREQILSYDLTVESGTLLTIQGRSGSGKSTLLDTIAGFVTPLQGEIRWQEDSLLELVVEQRPVSMLFQNNNLFEHLNGLQNILLGLNKNDNTTKDAIYLAATKLEINDFLLRKPPQLSGGQRQRIALLRTLLRPEPLVLLDEPFTGLDNHTRSIAAQWVRNQVEHKNKTVLLVTHQDDDVTQIADKNIELRWNSSERLAT